MATSYALLDGRLLLGTQTCPGCGYGRFPGKRVEFPLTVCPGCNGTGRRNGRRCRICNGIDCEPGRVRDLSNAQPVGPCSICGGSAEVSASWESHINLSDWDAPIDVEVLDSSAPPPDKRLFVGSIATVRDGGRTWLAYLADAIATTDYLIRFARAQLRYVQAGAVVDDDARLAARVIVYLTEHGFFVMSARRRTSQEWPARLAGQTHNNTKGACDG